MENSDKRIIFFGFSDVGYNCLKLLLDNACKVIAVFTHDRDPRENEWFPSVEELAKEAGIKVYKPSSVNTDKWIRKIRYMKPDLILSMFYRNFIPEEVISFPPLGSYNMHGSYLPSYRGRAPLNWSIINGENYCGTTLHVMGKKFDSGDIVSQEKVKFGDDEYVGEIQPRITKAAVRTLSKVLPLLLSGKAPRTKQDESQASYFGKRTPEDGRIDFKLSARSVYNLIRGVSKPYPGAFTDVLGHGKAVIWRASIGEKTPKGTKPGTVIFPKESGAKIKIACSDNFIEVEEMEYSR